MRKNKGYIFIEILIILGFISLVILPLVVLMNKNINIIDHLNHEREIRKINHSLEVIFTKIIEKGNIKKYTLEKSLGENHDFLLKENEKVITVLRNIKIDPNSRVFIEKREVKSANEKIGDIFIMKLKVKNRVLERILVIP